MVSRGSNWRRRVSALAALFLFNCSVQVGAQSEFQRGDTDANGQLNLTDPVAALGFLFQGGSVPSCMDAADSNDDGQVNLTDAVYTLSHLFQGGTAPPAPFPDCGVDASEDELDCLEFESCVTETNVSASISASPQGGEAPLEVLFDAAESTSTGSAIASYAWDFGDGSTGSGVMVSHTFAADGTYTVVLTVTTEDGSVGTSQQDIVVGGGGGPGDLGGFITVDHSMHRTCVGPEVLTEERFDATAAFLEVDFIDVTTQSPLDCEVSEEMVAGCLVERVTCSFDIGLPEPGLIPAPGDPPGLAELLEGVEGVDPGRPGTITNGAGAESDLVSTEIPGLPVARFIFEPPEDTDLSAAGFDCGQMVDISFPGGEDLATFTASVQMPPCFTGFTPTDCDISPDAGDLVLTWDDAPGYDGMVTVQVVQSAVAFDMAEAATLTVTVECSFPDNDGGGTIPGAALAALPNTPTVTSTLLSAERLLTDAVDWPRADGAGTRRVAVVTSTELEISESSFDFPVPLGE